MPSVIIRSNSTEGNLYSIAISYTFEKKRIDKFIGTSSGISMADSSADLCSQF